MNLSLKTQGKKGGVPKFQEGLGFITTFLRHSEDCIIVDDFEGSGKNYKQRQQTLITIIENGAVIFEGSKLDLFEKLKK